MRTGAETSDASAIKELEDRQIALNDLKAAFQLNPQRLDRLLPDATAYLRRTIAKLGGEGLVSQYAARKAELRRARELFDGCAMHERLAIALDTCHLFAGGYALDTSEGVAACFAELRSVGLARRLRLVHANDSKYGRGAHRDSHEHIGKGHIGERGFAAILRQPAVKRCPVVVETAGEDADRARDVATLRRLSMSR